MSWLVLVFDIVRISLVLTFFSEDAHRQLVRECEALRAAEADGDWTPLDRLTAPPSEDESSTAEKESASDSESYFTAAEV